MDQTSAILKTLLDACSLRHRVLANNLANSSTPGYRRRDVSFKDSLSKAVKSGDPKNLANVVLDIHTDRTARTRPDGNSVSSRKELGMIAENSLLYGASARALSMKFEELRKAIKG